MSSLTKRSAASQAVASVSSTREKAKALKISMPPNEHQKLDDFIDQYRNSSSHTLNKSTVIRIALNLLYRQKNPEKYL